MKRRLKRLYLGYRRHSSNLFVSLPAFLEQRFSYFSVLRRIYRILPGQLHVRFFVILLLSLIRAVVETSSIFVISLMAQSVSSPQSIRARWIYRTIVPYLPDYFIFRLTGDRTLITTMCMLVVGFIIMKNITVCITMAYTTIFSEKVGLFISREAYARFLAKDYLWHISKNSTDMIGRINNRGHLSTLTALIIQIFSNLLCGAMMFIFLCSINFRLTTMVVSIFFIVCVVTYWVLRNKIDRTGTESGQLDTKLNWAVRMVTRGIREIIIYRKQSEFLAGITENINQNISRKTFLAVSGNIPGWFLEITGFCIIFTSMVYMVGNDEPMPNVISAMSMLLLTAWRVLPMVSRSMGMAVRIRGIRSRALSCLEMLESFAGAPEEPAPADPVKLLPYTRTIELRDAGFRYPNSKADCIRSLSLAIRKGEHIGLIGKSGAGKSTLGMMLAGLFTPASGHMLVDGQEIAAGNLDAYRSRVGYVPQSPLLLPGTIADNIALSSWGEARDVERIEQACRFAAMDFVLSGKKSLDFAIGEGGDGLSGGEAQRLSIARALYTNPEIIIFDEATSSLDQESESAINRSIQSLHGSITTVVIAHRLTTVENCDRLIWLENGQIKAEGPPAEILPRYAAELGKKAVAAAPTKK